MPFEVQTGNTVAFNTVDLVARVEGFLTSQNYVDGAIVKKGDTLFIIEQTMYKAKVKEAEAGLEAAKALAAAPKAELQKKMAATTSALGGMTAAIKSLSDYVTAHKDAVVHSAS